MKAVMDKNIKLRPSIETTFHACLNWSIVAHTHSVSTLVHAISEKGIKIAKEKLNDMPLSVIKYIKPGIDLTKEIMDNLNPKTQVFILKNHGLICCGNSVKEVSDLIRKVELRLKMPIIRKIDQLFESENIPIDSLNERIKHVVQSCFNGKRLVVFSGGSSKDKESLLKEIKELYLGGASGSIIGRNSFQRPYTEAIALLNQIIDIYKGK